MSENKPPMPTGVELVFPNGKRRPLEVFYVGKKGDMHVWQITATIRKSEGGDLRIKHQPAFVEVRAVVVD